MLMHVPSKSGMPMDTTKQVHSKQHTPAATQLSFQPQTHGHAATTPKQQRFRHCFENKGAIDQQGSQGHCDSPQQDTAKLPVQQRSLLLQLHCRPCPAYWSPMWPAEQALHTARITDNLPCKCLVWQDGSQLHINGKPYCCLDDGAVLDGGIAHDDHDATLDHVALLLVVNVLRNAKQRGHSEATVHTSNNKKASVAHAVVSGRCTKWSAGY